MHSQALRDRREPIALTYCEVACLTKDAIEATAKAHVASARRLRMEAFKIGAWQIRHSLLERAVAARALAHW